MTFKAADAVCAREDAARKIEKTLRKLESKYNTEQVVNALEGAIGRRRSAQVKAQLARRRAV